jgi:ABC-2 type transport system permease protein
MRPYKALFLARTRIHFQYRAAAFAGFLTQAFFGLVRIMVMTGFFAAAGGGIPMNLAQTVNYIWLGQILFRILPFSIDEEIAAMIRNGNVAYELVRPVNLHAYWFTRSLVLRSVPILLSGIPLVLLSAVILPLAGRADLALLPPASPEALAGTAISLFLAVFISAGITAFASFLTLVFLTQDGVVSFLYILVWGLTGVLVPLPFFPDLARQIFLFLPLRGMVDVPCQIYSGTISRASIPFELALQAFWALLLFVAGHLLCKSTTRRVTVQGG